MCERLVVPSQKLPPAPRDTSRPPPPPTDPPPAPPGELSSAAERKGVSVKVLLIGGEGGRVSPCLEPSRAVISANRIAGLSLRAVTGRRGEKEEEESWSIEWGSEDGVVLLWCVEEVLRSFAWIKNAAVKTSICCAVQTRALMVSMLP